MVQAHWYKFKTNYIGEKMTKHKVFISFHHANDIQYKKKFIEKFGNYFINKSVDEDEYGDVLSDEYVKRLIREDKISDCSVVVVLIGAETYKRKHVDWEIYAGLSGKAGGYSGLIGVLLPSYYSSSENKDLNGSGYNSSTIPPRLNDNLKSGYSFVYKWESASCIHSNGNYAIEDWIDEAFNRKNNESDKIDNSRKQFERNR